MCEAIPFCVANCVKVSSWWILYNVTSIHLGSNCCSIGQLFFGFAGKVFEYM